LKIGKLAGSDQPDHSAIGGVAGLDEPAVARLLAVGRRCLVDRLIPRQRK
jgi:hypothetical protein